MSDRYILFETVNFIADMRNAMSEERFNEFRQNVDLFGLWKCVIIKYASKYSYTEFSEKYHSEFSLNEDFGPCYEENLIK